MIDTEYDQLNAHLLKARIEDEKFKKNHLYLKFDNIHLISSFRSEDLVKFTHDRLSKIDELAGIKRFYKKKIIGLSLETINQTNDNLTNQRHGDWCLSLDDRAIVVDNIVHWLMQAASNYLDEHKNRVSERNILFLWE